MSKTIEELPKERMIETPNGRNTNGYVNWSFNGGHKVVSFYPKMGFFNIGNQLVNHVTN